MSPQPLPIPLDLQPYFQEYDLADLQVQRDANLIIAMEAGRNHLADLWKS